MSRSLCTFLAVALGMVPQVLNSASTSPSTKDWVDVSSYDSTRDAWRLEIQSTDPSRLVCTFFLDYHDRGKHMNGPVGVVVPRFTGEGAATAGSTWGPIHVVNVTRSVNCVPIATDPASTGKPPVAFNPACLAGEWKEQYENPEVWLFIVDGDRIHVERSDHFVTGRFYRRGDIWIGKLFWHDAANDVWKDVVLRPSSDCSEIRTNKQWWYHR